MKCKRCETEIKKPTRIHKEGGIDGKLRFTPMYRCPKCGLENSGLKIKRVKQDGDA